MSNTLSSTASAPEDKSFKEFAAWTLVVALPWGFYAQLGDGLSAEQGLFVTLALAAILMWIFRLMPDFVPGLALILFATLLDLVPQQVAFSGFYSNIFFLVFGIFILAALLSETSWLARLEQLLLRKQASLLTRLFAVIAAGVLLTLVVPSPLGRASMVQPLVQRFFKPQRVQSNSFIALIHVHATTLVSTVILTGNPLNFILIGMLSEQIRDRFGWLGWLQAASMAGLVFSLGLVVAVVFIAKRSKDSAIPAQTVASPVETNPLFDWMTLGLYAFMMLAILTRSIHQIQLQWIILALAMLVFFAGGLSLATLRQKLDWPTLIFIATVVAWGPMLDHLGLSGLLENQLKALPDLIKGSLYLGMAYLIGIVFLVRLAVPGAPAFIIMTSAILPFADTLGISPWVLGFVILTVSEGFIWPYQHGVFSQTVTMLDGDGTDYRIRTIILCNILFLLLRCGAVFASIPLWQALNLM
ncbi:SLC13 family permease [Yoonia sediminilitoris]|uniref:Di/tricarboxylate transporter n=1 Tax=Yoonia sediminilitoris TaxID=1286148 RepID=A0A2T6KPK5_9RHOB|nr:SLC13 family permease [Yoonia sediminilitoris]PUB18500.1 di/tricarboxylate transporter [Yoonia sediminilitoris]RCW98668.1 di/tricarboxylate transporter [Yoonia sediminilitoris]